MLVGGEWREAASAQTLSLSNPSDGSALAQIARGGAADIAAALGAAQVDADGDWGCMRTAERGRVLPRMSALVLEQAAGLPAGALNIVPGLGEEVGAALSAHPGVAHLSFTGSVTVGRLIQAAAARDTIPVTLELGGKSPQIVFADADLDPALLFLVNSVIQNAGQTCSAAVVTLPRRCSGRWRPSTDWRRKKSLARCRC